MMKSQFHIKLIRAPVTVIKRKSKAYCYE